MFVVVAGLRTEQQNLDFGPCGKSQGEVGVGPRFKFTGKKKKTKRKKNRNDGEYLPSSTFKTRHTVPAWKEKAVPRSIEANCTKTPGIVTVFTFS